MGRIQERVTSCREKKEQHFQGQTRMSQHGASSIYSWAGGGWGGKENQEVGQRSRHSSYPHRQPARGRVELYIKRSGFSRNLSSQRLFQPPQKQLHGKLGQRDWSKLVGTTTMVVGIFTVLHLASKGSPSISHGGSCFQCTRNVCHVPGTP